MTTVPSTSGTVDGKDMDVIKADLDKFFFQEISLTESTITTIAAKKKRTFVDPHVYKEGIDDNES